MHFELGTGRWVNQPKHFEVNDDEIKIVTEAGTDLWQRTYYQFRNDNAPMLLWDIEAPYFTFWVKTFFETSHQRFDQCGVILYQNSENWMKGSVEYETEEFAHLGSVVTNRGYSDWATQEIPSDIKHVWYRLSRRDDDFCIEASFDGINYQQLRIAHLHESYQDVSVGIYGASPEDSSLTAIFSEMKVTDCVWQAHQGQAPDENLIN